MGRRRWAPALLAGLIVAASTVVGTAPASSLPSLPSLPLAESSSWSVSLATSATSAEVGTSITLTATANQSVTGTGFFIDIFDQTTGTPIAGCTVGTTCHVMHSQSQPGTHTYIAHVDSDPVLHYPPCCIAATSNTVTVSWHARATAVFDVDFTVAGTLPTFPCSSGCTAPFSGTGHGAGSAHAETGGVLYSAAFDVPAGSVTGWATYTEPDPPMCPALGSAAGQVTLSGSASGLVSRSSTPLEPGTVTSARFTLDYTYVRAGAGALIVVTGGRAVIDVWFPSTGYGSFVSAVDGGGPGAFEVAPAVAATRCTNPGPVDFTVVGDVALRLAE